MDPSPEHAAAAELAAADDQWRRALGRYIELARSGATRAALAAAAAAVHKAAVERSRLEHAADDAA